MGDEATTDEYLSLIEASASAFLAQKHRLGRLRETSVPSLWAELGDLGLLGLNLPETDGGSGLGAVGVARITRLFGEVLLPDPFVAHAVIPASVIGCLPPGAERALLAADLIGGLRSMTLAWQEESNELSADRCTATLGSDGLTGKKIAVPYAEIVFATVRTEGGLAVVRATDVSAETRPRTLDKTGFGPLDLSHLTVTAPPLLTGDMAAKAVRRAVDLGALAVSAQLCGVARGAFALTLEHLKTRRQFGAAIGDFQAIQHRAVDLLMALALADASVSEAASRWDENPDHPSTVAAISAAKARAGTTALLVVREAVQMHGAIGFTEEADVGLYVRAALSLNAWLGSARAHRRRFVSLESANV